MNAKQRRKIYRERVRRDGSYYVVFRVDDEAVAVARHATGMNLTFVNSNKNPLLFAWGPDPVTQHTEWTRQRYSGKIISEPEATTLVEFGVPLYCNSQGYIILDL